MIEDGTIVAAHAHVYATKGGHPVLVTVGDIVEGADAAGYARGVADERARTKERIDKLTEDLDYYKRVLEECHRDSPCRD